MAMSQMPGAVPESEEMPQEQPQGGYCIQICVLPSGEISVSKTDQMPAEQGDSFPGIKEALGEALNIYNANPVGADDQKEFEAGYGGGQMGGMNGQGPVSRF
jgi:hypothetical protein